MTIIIQGYEGDTRYLVADRLIGSSVDLSLSAYPKLVAHLRDGVCVGVSGWAGYAACFTPSQKAAIIDKLLDGHPGRAFKELKRLTTKRQLALSVIFGTASGFHKLESDCETGQFSLAFPAIGGMDFLLKGLRPAASPRGQFIEGGEYGVASTAIYRVGDVVYQIWTYHLQAGFVQPPEIVCCDTGASANPISFLSQEQRTVIEAMIEYVTGFHAFVHRYDDKLTAAAASDH